ncbi:branched-chain amino acid aminotransferase [Niallia nealsonii]|uniref:Branched-chain amino acid aminotransferase n=1 Tax=Niallia nealsonii TaxID=115979 RepID=A0A2N0Z0B8_9BACI|nr:branched-chain amino acid aminotransferase [Niallia nealsonii]PKG22956.1 branched-chain amino acid aminotransferase [Niallia nealsonii]
MLKKQMQIYIEQQTKTNGSLFFFSEEKKYLLGHSFVVEKELEEKNTAERFPNIYLELASKETDETIEENVDSTFLATEIHYFEKKIEEYLYVESDAFVIVGVESLSLEVDSVFRTYEGIFGLKIPKKAEGAIRSFFEKTLEGNHTTYNLMFNAQDGMWDVNLPIEAIPGFSNQMNIGDVLQLIYLFLFQLGEELEKKQ